MSKATKSRGNTGKKSDAKQPAKNPKKTRKAQQFPESQKASKSRTRKNKEQNRQSFETAPLPPLPSGRNLRTYCILMAAVGDAFLTPDDPRTALIIEQRNKMMGQQKMTLQKKWGITSEESHKAVEKAWLSLRKSFLKDLCGGEFRGDNIALEKWVIHFLKDDPFLLFKAYSDDPILKQQAKRRGKDFFTYVGQIADSKIGKDKLFSSPRGLPTGARICILTYWCESLCRNIPPFCLWTDSALSELSEDQDKPITLDYIRQIKSRYKLFSPRRRYTLKHNREGKSRFQFCRELGVN
jgi:hypothetical protein